MSPRKRTGFVKSGDTEASVAASQKQLTDALRRYGCSALAIASDYAKGEVRIAFSVNPEPGQKVSTSRDGAIPVEFVVNMAKVAYRLRANGYDARMEQAERVAWRHLVLWVDAALTSVESGMQSMEEAFYPHLMVRDVSGARGRLIDFVKGGDGPGLQLLGAGATNGGE
jgi:hypothetical protein